MDFPSRHLALPGFPAHGCLPACLPVCVCRSRQTYGGLLWVGASPPAAGPATDVGLVPAVSRTIAGRLHHAPSGITLAAVPVTAATEAVRRNGLARPQSSPVKRSLSSTSQTRARSAASKSVHVMVVVPTGDGSAAAVPTPLGGGLVVCWGVFLGLL